MESFHCIIRSFFARSKSIAQVSETQLLIVAFQLPLSFPSVVAHAWICRAASARESEMLRRQTIAIGFITIVFFQVHYELARLNLAARCLPEWEADEIESSYAIVTRHTKLYVISHFLALQSIFLLWPRVFLSLWWHNFLRFSAFFSHKTHKPCHHAAIYHPWVNLNRGRRRSECNDGVDNERP